MNLHNFLYGVYPYIALSVFLLGSLLRFDREQYTWKSDSSQLLSKANMRLASNLFHVGIIAIFFGHAVGLLTSHSVFRALGVSDMAHQMIAIWAGSIFRSEEHTSELQSQSNLVFRLLLLKNIIFLLDYLLLITAVVIFILSIVALPI